MAKVTLMFNIKAGSMGAPPGPSCSQFILLLHRWDSPRNPRLQAGVWKPLLVQPRKEALSLSEWWALTCDLGARTRTPIFSFTTQPFVVNFKPRLMSFPLSPRLSPLNADNSSWKRLFWRTLKYSSFKPQPQASLPPLSILGYSVWEHPTDFQLKMSTSKPKTTNLLFESPFHAP